MHFLQITLKGEVLYNVQPKIRVNSRMGALDFSSLLMTDMLPVIGSLFVSESTHPPVNLFHIN